MKKRWHNASLKGAFVTYAVVYLVAGAIVASVLAACIAEVGNEATQDGRELTGLYLYDEATDELVPATSVYVGEEHAPLYVETTGNGTRRIALADLPEDARIDNETGWLYFIATDSETADFTAVSPLGFTGGKTSLKEPAPGDVAESASAESASTPYPTEPLLADQTIVEFSSKDEPSDTLAIDDLAAYDREARTAVTQLVQKVAGGETARIIEEAASSTSADGGPLASPVAYYLYEEPSAGARTMMTTLGLLSVAMFPLWIGAALTLAARRFYDKRVKPALGLLDDASAKIAERDLDFTVSYDRRDEMGRLADSFEVMRASLAQSQHELMRTSEERRRLNAAFAHDLRTPLTVLRGKIELMAARIEAADVGRADQEGDEQANDTERTRADAAPARNSGKLDVEALARDVTSLGAQVERLERYVAAMSSLRKLEERQVMRASIDVDALARELREEGAGLCRPHGVAFELADTIGNAPACANGTPSEHERIAVDRALVLEVADNLLANAARYARSRVVAHLSIEQTTGSARTLVLVVDDDGPGFSPEARERGCEAFFGENRGAKHLGLGLNIARVLCERHGGSLELGASPTGGARVVARFSL